MLTFSSDFSVINEIFTYEGRGVFQILPNIYDGDLM